MFERQFAKRVARQATPRRCMPWRALAVTAAVAVVSSTAQADPGSVPAATGFEGFWEATDKTVLEFRRCRNEQSLCGYIVQASEYGTDQANPDKALRLRPICGLQIVELADFDGKMWKNGRVYDPTDGKSYRSALRLRDDKLFLRAYIGTEIFGETEKLLPLPSFNKSCKAKGL